MNRRILIVLSSCLIALIFSASAHASGGTVVSWGYNGYGEAGTGSRTENSCECLVVPVATPLTGVSQTARGYYHSLFLSTDGTVKSVGYNHYGELGNGSTTDNPTPTAVPGLSNVVAVAAAGEFSLALLSNGTVMSWGENESGALGLGTTTGPEECNGTPCANHPVPIPGLSNVVAIAAGGEQGFALLANGTVMGWGYDYYGQLGDGTGMQTGCYCIDHPVAVPGVTNAIAISAGESWAGALLADHSLMAWGESDYGQLGNGSTSNYNPTCTCLPPTKTLTSIKSFAAGDYHGVAALLDGSVKTWGYNTYAQVGNGTTGGGSCGCVPDPTTILTGVGAQAASAGTYYDGMVLLSDGTLRGWGYNGYGELGDGTEEERLSPVSAYGVGGASALNLGYYGGSAIIGPSQTLSVAFAGAGAGTVEGGGEIGCPTICTAKYPQGKVISLTATSTAGGFAGFSGPCTGTATCQAKMETDQTVTATFGAPAGTKITKAKIVSPKKKATFSFSAPGAITGYQCKLIRPKPKKQKGKPAKKQKKPKFANCKGPKTIKNLKPGKYTFQVRALDVLGADAKPAKRVFNIHPPKKHKKKK